MTSWKPFGSNFKIPVAGWIRKGSNAIDKTIDGALNGRSRDDQSGSETADERLRRSEFEFTTEFMGNMENATVADVAGMEALYEKYMPEIYEDRTEVRGDKIHTSSVSEKDNFFDQRELENLRELRKRILNPEYPKSKPAAEAAAKQEKEAAAPNDKSEVSKRRSQSGRDKPEEQQEKPPESSPESSQEPDEKPAEQSEPKTYTAEAKTFPLEERGELKVEPLPEETEIASAKTYAIEPREPLVVEPLPAEPATEMTGLLARADEIDGPRDYLRDLDSEQVKEIQRELGVDADGKFGQKTMAAAQEYMQDRGLDKNTATFDELLADVQGADAEGYDEQLATKHALAAAKIESGALTQTFEVTRGQLYQDLQADAKQQAEQSLAASQSDLEQDMAFKPDVGDMKEQIAASLNQNGLDSSDGEMVAENQTAPPPTGPGLG